MENSRWWHLAVTGSTIVMIVLFFLLDLDPTRRWGAMCAMLAFALGWILLGRNAWRDRRSGFAFACLIVLVTLVGTAFVASFAFIQFIAYPLVWTLTERVRTALAFNLAVCGGVITGFALSTRLEPREMAINAIVQLVSLGFSISFGLWISSIAARSHERQRLLDELRATQGKLDTLNREAGATDERERLAREIHDTIAQSLTGLVMLAQRARRETDAVALDSHLALLEESARAALVDTRSLVAASAPVDFTHGGLGDALGRLADRFTREAGIAVSVAIDAHAEQARLDRDTEVVLLRCAQESLANVRKHSGATSARIALTVVDGRAALRVSDDGRGFHPGEYHPGFGLPGMRERLAIVGGILEIDSAVGAGTTVSAKLPVPEATMHETAVHQMAGPQAAGPQAAVPQAAPSASAAARESADA